MPARAPRLALLLLALAGAGCSGPDPWQALERVPREVPRRPSAAARSEGTSALPLGASDAGARVGAGDALFTSREAPRSLAVVAGRTIEPRDLLAALYFFRRAQTQEILHKVVEDRMVLAEARRLGVSVPVALVDREVDRLLAELEGDIQRESGGKMNLDRYLDEQLFLTRKVYQQALRRYVSLGLLRDRVIRFCALHEERLLLRGITVLDARAAWRIQRDLLAGADFDTLLEQASVHPSRERGGRWPALPLDDPHPVVAAVLAAERAGGDRHAFLPPVHEKLRGKDYYHIVQLLEHTRADARSFDSCAGEIERSLAEQAVTREEYLIWVRAAARRYPVEKPRAGSEPRGG